MRHHIAAFNSTKGIRNLVNFGKHSGSWDTMNPRNFLAWYEIILLGKPRVDILKIQPSF